MAVLPEIEFTFIRTLGDASAELDAELQQLYESMRSQGVDVSDLRKFGSINFGAGIHWEFLNGFIAHLAPTVVPILGTVLGAWLNARYGRKVRVKIGDIEAEARTPEELERLLEKAQKIRERNEPKRILP